MKVGIVQDGPVYLDAEGTFDKTVDYLDQAKRDEVDLIVFGESWFSGYPVWLDVCADISLWDHPPVKDVWHQMFQNGLSADGDMIKDLRAAIAKAGIYVVIGANEPVSKGPNNGTIFNTIYTFDHKGTLVNHHRKLVPTYTEKLVHGHGDGYGLRAIDTPKGRIGSLVCWEHWMPLTRQAMHDEGEDLHIALWPHVKETHHLASRHYAHEGRCHVVAVGQVMQHDELPSQLTLSPTVQLPDSGLLMQGRSAIYAPSGETILDPVEGKRGLISVELDLNGNGPERMNLAVSGHYQRHDVFDLQLNRSRK